MPMTASANNTTRRVDARLAAAWCSKKFTGSELDLRRGTHRRLLVGRDLEQRGRGEVEHAGDDAGGEHFALVDRKSTRLNSSHVKISYAVFCLKKKKTNYLY